MKSTKLKAGDSVFDYLHDAVYAGDSNGIKTILRENQGILAVKDKHGATILHYVCSPATKKKACVEESKHADGVRTLLEGKADVNVRDRWGSTPLMWGCIEPIHQCVLQTLIMHQETKVGEKNKNGNTARQIMEDNFNRLRATNAEEMKRKDYYREALLLFDIREAQDKKDKASFERSISALEGIRRRLLFPYEDERPVPVDVDPKFVRFLEVNTQHVVAGMSGKAGDAPIRIPVILPPNKEVAPKIPAAVAFISESQQQPALSLVPVVDDKKDATNTIKTAEAKIKKIQDNINAIMKLGQRIKHFCKELQKKAKRKVHKQGVEDALTKINYIIGLYQNTNRKISWDFSNHQQQLKLIQAELIELKNSINKKKTEPSKVNSSTRKIAVLTQQLAMKVEPKVPSEQEEKAIQAKEQKALKRRAMHFHHQDQIKLVLKELLETVRKKEEANALTHSNQYSLMWRLRNPMSQQEPAQEERFKFASTADPVFVRR